MSEEGINKDSTERDILNSLKPLGRLPIDLHDGIYKYLLITDYESDQGRFKMRNEDRTKCIEKTYEVLLWLTGLEDLGPAGIDELQKGWGSLLLEGQTPEYEHEVWETLTSLRMQIVSENSN